MEPELKNLTCFFTFPVPDKHPCPVQNNWGQSSRPRPPRDIVTYRTGPVELTWWRAPSPTPPRASLEYSEGIVIPLEVIGMHSTDVDVAISKRWIPENINRSPLHGLDVMTEETHDQEGNDVPEATSTDIGGRDLETMIALIIPMLREHGVTKAGVYGSRVRGDHGEDSDLDVLVELPEDFSLLDLAGLQLELEDVLGMKVDVVTYDGLHPRLRDGILEEERRIL